MSSIQPNSRPIRALVIGAGPAAAMLHLPVLAGLQQQGKLALIAIADLVATRATAAQRQFGFLYATGDAESVLRGTEVDAIYLFGSAQLHHNYGMIALQSGKHLFVEKPISPSFLQAQELAAAAKSNGLIAVGGHNRRFYKSLAAVRARACNGGWRFGEATFHKPEHGKPPPYGARTWLSANGIHALDALLFMMGGLPEWMAAVAETMGTPWPSAFSANMRWRDGSQGVFVCNNAAGSRREAYVFHGPGESYTASEDSLMVEASGQTERLPMPGPADGIVAEHEAFVQAIPGCVMPVHSLEAIAPSLFLAELIEQSFCGKVQLPAAASISLAPRLRSGKSILLIKPEELLPAVGQLLSGHRLVALEDVLASAKSRPDIVAAIVGRGGAPLAPDTLTKLPNLAVVGVVGLSLASIEPAKLLERGIQLINATATYAEAVAEYALGLTILGRRRAFISHAVMRRGGWGTDARHAGLAGRLRRMAVGLRPVIRWLGLETQARTALRELRPMIMRSSSGAATVRELRHATVGLLGWGANAKAFAGRLLSAQARVIVYSEHAPARDILAAGAIPASMPEVLAADVVSLHRGLTRETRHFLQAAELARLRPGALLINVARGALIEPRALLARLRRGDISACLDTFDEEPLAASHPLRRLPNVFLSSHIAGGYPDMYAAAADEVVAKVAAYVSGDPTGTVGAGRLATMT